MLIWVSYPCAVSLKWFMRWKSFRFKSISEFKFVHSNVNNRLLRIRSFHQTFVVVRALITQTISRCAFCLKSLQCYWKFKQSRAGRMTETATAMTTRRQRWLKKQKQRQVLSLYTVYVSLDMRSHTLAASTTRHSFYSTYLYTTDVCSSYEFVQKLYSDGLFI